MTPDEFVSRIQEALAADKRSRALNLIFDTIENLLLAQAFGEAEACLQALIRSKPPLPCILAALTVIKPWRQELRTVRADLIAVVLAIPPEELRDDLLGHLLEP